MGKKSRRQRAGTGPAAGSGAGTAGAGGSGEPHLAGRKGHCASCDFVYAITRGQQREALMAFAAGADINTVVASPYKDDWSAGHWSALLRDDATLRWLLAQPDFDAGTISSKGITSPTAPS